MAYNYKLRVKHLVEKAGSSNPAVIAKMLGINIRYVDTPNNINGFWKRILRRKFIFVNERLDEWQRKADGKEEIDDIIDVKLAKLQRKAEEDVESLG